MILTKEQIAFKARNALEEDSQETRDFLEQNINEIVTELIRLEATEDSFLDLFQNEIEKYSEYLAIE